MFFCQCTILLATGVFWPYNFYWRPGQFLSRPGVLGTPITHLVVLEPGRVFPQKIKNRTEVVCKKTTWTHYCRGNFQDAGYPFKFCLPLMGDAFMGGASAFTFFKTWNFISKKRFLKKSNWKCSIKPCALLMRPLVPRSDIWNFIKIQSKMKASAPPSHKSSDWKFENWPIKSIFGCRIQW